MATTAEHFADVAHDAGVKSDAAMRRKGGQLHKFFDDVEELLRRVSSMQDAEISRLRTRACGVPLKFRAIKAASARASSENPRPWQFSQTLRTIFSLGRSVSFWLWSTRTDAASRTRGRWQVAHDAPLLPLGSAAQSRACFDSA